MNKFYLTLTFLVISLSMVWSQQLPDRSYFREMSFVWNPAMTGETQHWEAFAAYREQWSGFEGNPRTVSVGTHIPILDYNMGVGGYITQDYVQPVSSTNIGLTYAYQLEVGLFGEDVLSIGLLGSFSQLGVEASEIVINDGGDALVPTGDRSAFSFNAGFGLYYVSHSNAYSQSFSDESYFFIGLAVNQLIPSNLTLSEGTVTDNYKRAIHANAIIGGRILTSDAFFVEPYLWMNYAEGNVFNMNFGVTGELVDVVWGGLSYSTTQSATLQAGYIYTAGLPRYNSIRIGSAATINSADVTRPRGLSYEFYLAYRYLL